MENKRGVTDTAENGTESTDIAGGGNAMLRLPYAIAKNMGILTEGLTPSQVWDRLKGNGISPKKEIGRLSKNNVDGDKKSVEGFTNGGERIKIKRANTVEEAAQIAVNVGLAKHANFKFISIETANFINETIFLRKNEYPCIGEFEYIGNNSEHIKLSLYSAEQYVISELMKIPRYASDPAALKRGVDYNMGRIRNGMSLTPTAQAAFWDGRRYGLRGIKFHAKNMDDAASMERDVLSGFHPVGTGSKQGVIDHELGHAIHDLLELSKHPEINRLYDENMRNGTMGRELSRYVIQEGRKSRDIGLHEFVAEAFSEYKNNPDPRPLAKAVGKIIDEENEKWIKMNTQK